MGKKLLLAALAAVAVLGVRGTRRRANDAYLETQTYEDVYYLPPTEWLPVLSLGYRSALADLLWVRALVYFGEELAHQGEVRHLFEYTDGILALDPDFRAVYRWVGVTALYRPGQITAEDAQRAVDYLERAVRRWPDDGELAWDLGATLRFELPPLLDDRAAVDDARLRGAEHLRTAALLGAGPPWLALTTAATFEKQGRTEQAIRHLEEIYASVSDPATKQRIEQRLARLQSRQYADNLRAALEAFEAERQASYPYVPPGLYLLLGERTEAAWYAALERRFLPEPGRGVPATAAHASP